MKLHSETSPGARRATVLAAYAVAAILVAWPVARMIGIVLDGSALQHADYWLMLGRFTNPAGTLDLSGLFDFQNEHPVVVAQVLYWLNMHLFSGSNIALGLVVVAIAVAQLAVIADLARRSHFRRAQKLGLVVLASALLFDLTGTWNFSKAMSGSAWLTANLFAVLAVYLRTRDRSTWAFGMAALSAASYATGIAAWPAVIAAGACTKSRTQWWREWPYVVGLASTYIWYETVREPGGSTSSSSPVAIARETAGLLSFPFGLDGDVAVLAGAIGLVAGVVLAARVATSAQRSAAAGWVGIAAFGVLATLEIAYARNDSVALGDKNRYSSLPALTWIGLAGLLVFVLGDRRRHGDGSRRLISQANASLVSIVVILPLFIGAITAGEDIAERMLDQNTEQELREVALRFGLADGSTFLLGGFSTVPTDITETARATDHYPFVDSWNLDCGLLGRELDVEATGEIPGQLHSASTSWILPGGIELRGRVDSSADVRCIVISNRAGRVIGAASLETPADAAPDGAGATRFRAIAHRDDGPFRAHVVLEDGSEPLLLGDVITEEQIE